MQTLWQDTRYGARMLMKQRGFTFVAVLTLALPALLGITFLLWRGTAASAQKGTGTKSSEELVYVKAKDDIPNGGALFTPTKESAKPIAVIWIHGWGVNFYYPTYVKVGRALAELGYACVTANTRMHDLGTVAGHAGGKRIRGGGYWGIASEEVRDLAAWIDFAEARGFKQVVLVGHSAGWAAVRLYQSENQDRRVVGVVLASGAVRAETRPTDPDQLAQATRLIAEGKGDALVHDPKRSFPSYISAATFMDIANSPLDQKDFFGVQTPNPAVMRIQCPLLAFFGTNGDVGNAAELELLKSSLQRLSSGPSRVTTSMIQNADHMYTGEEAQVAQTIARWADSLVPRK